MDALEISVGQAAPGQHERCQFLREVAARGTAVHALEDDLSEVPGRKIMVVAMGCSFDQVYETRPIGEGHSRDDFKYPLPSMILPIVAKLFEQRIHNCPGRL